MLFNFYVIRGFAHRIMKNGLMESAPIMHENGVMMIDEKSFEVRSAVDMNLSGGDYAQIQQDLSRYSHMMPADYVLPESVKAKMVETSNGMEPA